MIQVTGDAEDPTAAFLVNHLTANNNTIENPMITSISREPNQQLDPRPHPLSPAWSNVTTIEEATGVDYRGAFGYENWAKMWTALDAMGYFGDLYVSSKLTDNNGFNLGQNYPNPFSGTTTIEYTLSERAKVNLSVIDITGKVIRTVVSETQSEGTYKVNVSGLRQGIYFYRLVANENKATNKMIVR
jgi:hypothetical protein